MRFARRLYDRSFPCRWRTRSVSTIRCLSHTFSIATAPFARFAAIIATGASGDSVHSCQRDSERRMSRANDQCPMPNVQRSSNDQCPTTAHCLLLTWSLELGHSLVIGHWSLFIPLSYHVRTNG